MGLMDLWRKHRERVEKKRQARGSATRNEIARRSIAYIQRLQESERQQQSNNS